ncbi:hypothetical protein [Stigmatella erecta]|uniref:Uncharacterized protein n=1 Tax=Stigmatella erecta TaxID=83460 RepID=A0A1I0L0D2_9BACT|nr:hypothetical protein [Stigmatella erecta]SEU32231.1 hypothetical protein SAMN05443639_116167 [Stigmatella erecta]
MATGYPPFNIDAANTCWVFLSGSSEARHLHDIVFANDVLKKRGVPSQNILVFTDHPAYQLHLAPYGITNTFSSGAIASELAQRKGFKFVVAVITGHGDPSGISVGTGASINPAEISAAVRGCPGVQAGIIILGQCFAGLFNYINAGTGEPPLCVMGATNLNPSLSSLVGLSAAVKKSDGSDGLQSWVANIFLLHFFAWLHVPRDVDGDGRSTLMDAYRHAGVHANTHLRDTKRNLHLIVEPLRTQVVELSKQPLTPVTQLQVQAIVQQLDQALESLYLHQEPWILNAYLAASAQF